VVTLDTVKKHVTHVLGKLGAANCTEAVTRARQLGPDLLDTILSMSFASVMSQHE
jgi:ATP/maltotriose-dependent transcriptional regulator MalT